MSFQLHSPFAPAGDQPQAIASLLAGLTRGDHEQTLLGVTGSGKTFTMANIIAATQRPTLIISHNKTLAGQLYNEFKQFFPEAAVHYFVSYYDYYQPEAYLPQTDTYIEKETQINEEIDRLRHAATQALVNRRDTIIVASVSCIYGLGEKSEYQKMGLNLTKGQTVDCQAILADLISMQYQRDDIVWPRGSFRARGETVDIHLATGEATVRLIFTGHKLAEILYLPLNRQLKTLEINYSQAESLANLSILPAKHFMTPADKMSTGLKLIRAELNQRLQQMKQIGKLAEADRLERRTNYDLEMLETVGYCNGIENYSQPLSGRPTGAPPSTLIDFFPDDYLLFIDESHVTLPQIRGMYAGDQARKETLVEFGFRLPSARDNRPLDFREFKKKIKQVIYVSATPAEYELRRSQTIAEQIIRPTGLIDPQIIVRPLAKQIQDLMTECRARIKKGERILAITLTKKMSEDLSTYLLENNFKVSYLHSEIKTMARQEIIADLQGGKVDVLVGVNLLREGLDLPAVSLVAILNADVGGFLRTATALIQTIGRAARHLNGCAIFYADRITPAMRQAIDETERRRKIQTAYNLKHKITPKQIGEKI